MGRLLSAAVLMVGLAVHAQEGAHEGAPAEHGQHEGAAAEHAQGGHEGAGGEEHEPTDTPSYIIHHLMNSQDLTIEVPLSDHPIHIALPTIQFKLSPNADCNASGDAKLDFL